MAIVIVVFTVIVIISAIIIVRVIVLVEASVLNSNRYSNSYGSNDSNKGFERMLFVVDGFGLRKHACPRIPLTTITVYGNQVTCLVWHKN